MCRDGETYSPEVQDTAAEVDAAFRTLRRIALTYFVVFLMVLAGFPILTVALTWWTEARVAGNLSPAFLTAALGLYAVFAVIGIAAATLSSSVESRMLGQQEQASESAEPWDPAQDQEPHPGSGG